MTTYNSYEEAKIANPESEIFKSPGVPKAFTARPNSQLWFKCNPADHCMTIEKFLADGHKFAEGDLIFNSHPSPSVDCIRDEDLVDYNEFDEEDDDKRYILRAAALETKEPKRTKESTAIDTLERLGYEWKGGELWKPPIGEAPSYLLPKRTKVDKINHKASEYPNGSECKVSAILTLIESEFGSGALFAVADVLSGYGDKD
ncbi:hypothetical protein VPH209E381_0010 [Vibrio phage 209E38-1]